MLAPGALPDFIAFVGHTGLQWRGFSKWVRKLGRCADAQSRRPVLIFIHDLIPITHPEYCRAGQAAIHEVRIRNAIAAADLLVVNSEDTRRELEKFARNERLALPAVEVAKLASCLPSRPVEESSISRLFAEPYFAVVGTIEARKNHALLLKVWENLVSQHNALDVDSVEDVLPVIPKLMVIGQAGWRAEAVLKKLESCRWNPDGGGGLPPVVWLPDLDDSQVARLVQGAVALLMPSFAEGYGLPVAEALALKTPVVASDIPALREVGGEAALYLPPDDPDAWYSAVLKHLDFDFRAATVQRIRNWHETSWPEHFQIVERAIRSFPRGGGRAIVVGFKVWRQGVFLPLLKSLFGGKVIVFASSISEVCKLAPDNADVLLCWNQPSWSEELAVVAANFGCAFVRMEDGFLRSVGLGSDLIPPKAVVLDFSGIYFDPRTASDLEKLLVSADFEEEELARAARLIGQIRKYGLSKYNFPEDAEIHVPSWAARALGRKVLFVPGQVADDASVMFGCTSINSSMELLRIVRRENPRAFVVFRPHPDVTVGNRKGVGSKVLSLEELCDAVDSATPIAALLENVHEVHTLTSLVGFEGLLHGRQVFTYGVPFYAGWGLTIDRADVIGNPGKAWLARRKVRHEALTLESLAAGVLLRYCRYFNWTENSLSSAEETVGALLRERLAFHSGGSFRRRCRKARAVVAGAWTSLCHRSGFKKTF